MQNRPPDPFLDIFFWLLHDTKLERSSLSATKYSEHIDVKNFYLSSTYAFSHCFSHPKSRQRPPISPGASCQVKSQGLPKKKTSEKVSVHKTLKASKSLNCYCFSRVRIPIECPQCPLQRESIPPECPQCPLRRVWIPIVLALCWQFLKVNRHILPRREELSKSTRKWSQNQKRGIIEYFLPSNLIIAIVYILSPTLATAWGSESGATAPSPPPSANWGVHKMT